MNWQKHTGREERATNSHHERRCNIEKQENWGRAERAKCSDHGRLGSNMKWKNIKDMLNEQLAYITNDMAQQWNGKSTMVVMNKRQAHITSDIAILKKQKRWGCAERSISSEHNRLGPNMKWQEHIRPPPLFPCRCMQNKNIVWSQVCLKPP